MKRSLFYSALLLLLTSWQFSLAQSPSSSIDYLPYQASGYLIMNKLAHPQVTSWGVDIQTRTENSSGQFVYTTVYSEQVAGKSFTRLPEQYIGNDLFVRVKGSDANGTILTDSDPQPIGPGPHGWRACTKGCNGKTYAYLIDLNVNAYDTNCNLMVRSFSHPETGAYLYQYISHSDFWTMAGAPPLSYYGVPAWSHVAPGIGSRIIKLEGVVSGDGIKDEGGYTLTGTVYGVRKFLGPWIGSILESNTIAGGSSNCILNLGWFQTRINMGGGLDGRPPLTCNGSSIGDGGAPPTDGSGMASETADDCWEEISTWSGDESEIEPFEDPFEYLEDLTDCLDDMDITTVPDLDLWSADIVAFSIKPLYLSGANNMVTIKKQDLFNSQGEFNAPNITIQAGMNVLGVQFKGGHYRTLFFNQDQTTTYSYETANEVEATYYQVPVTGNSFQIDISTGANLSFDLTLHDLQGNLIHTDRKSVQGGQITTIQVQPANGIPAGPLVSTLTFDDGSTLSETIIK